MVSFVGADHCNQKYSGFEASTKSIIEKMLVSDALSASDINILLDWLDKVRVGLWLGYQYLNKNYGFTPEQAEAILKAVKSHKTEKKPRAKSKS